MVCCWANIGNIYLLNNVLNIYLVVLKIYEKTSCFSCKYCLHYLSLKHEKRNNLYKEKRKLYILFIECMDLKGYYLGDYLFDSRYRNVTKDVQAEMLETVNNNENDNDK